MLHLNRGPNMTHATAERYPGPSRYDRQRRSILKPSSHSTASEIAAPGWRMNGAPQDFAPGLYLVATPIGNLRDITLRALDLLSVADHILCEDTRVTAKLLQHYGISRPTLSYHEHNADRMLPRVMEHLMAGEVLALVSDAGTPLVSDPGYRLVRAAVERGIAVTALPGASAALAALSVAGLPTDRFLFAGFPPQKTVARRRFFEEFRDIPASLIFFESPHRVAASLEDAARVLGPRPAALCRELTKRFEEVRRGTLAELAAAYGAEQAVRGEIVLIVAPPSAPERPEAADLDALLRDALARLSVKEAASEVAAATGASRRELYARALALKDGRG